MKRILFALCLTCIFYLPACSGDKKEKEPTGSGQEQHLSGETTAPEEDQEKNEAPEESQNLSGAQSETHVSGS